MTIGDAAESGAAAFVETPFLGVRLARLDMQEAARVIAARPFGAPFAYVVTPNAQHFVLLDRGDDKRFSAAYANAWLRLCDSEVVCALARALFGEHLPHAAGSDLTAHLFAHFIQPDDRITVIGDDEELATRLRTQFHLTNLHHHNPPMGFINSPQASERCIEFVHSHPARYVFLAVGAPSSEILAHRIAAGHGAIGTGLCIGSSLRFLVGMAKRAPKFYRVAGLEWLHRLMADPIGHADRVFIQSFPLIPLMLRARFRKP